MAQHEASMAMGYLMDETLGLIIEYMQQVQSIRNRLWNSNEEEGVIGEVLEGTAIWWELPIAMRDIAHNYVLNNTNAMAPWVRWYKHSNLHENMS